MTANQFAKLVLRLLGVFFLAEAVPMLVLNIGSGVLAGEASSPAPSRTAVVTLLVLPLVFRIVIGIFLLTYAGVLAKKLAPEEFGSKLVTPIPFEDIQVFAFAVAGIFIFSATLPQLLKGILNLARALTNLSNDWSDQLLWMAGEIGVIVKAALGLALFFHARRFVNFWRSLRLSGTPKPPRTE